MHTFGIWSSTPAGARLQMLTSGVQGGWQHVMEGIDGLVDVIEVTWDPWNKPRNRARKTSFFSAALTVANRQENPPSGEATQTPVRGP